MRTWWQRLASSQKQPVTDSRLDIFVERSPIPIARLDEDSHILEYNQAFADLTHGSIHRDAPVKLITLLKEEQQKVLILRLAMCMKGQTPPDPVELEMHLPNGSMVTVSLYMSLMPDLEGREYAVVHLIDTTDQKNLEMRFAHSQKMQAVGQLAGGVAHDFNNLLTAMIGFCDLLLMRHPAGDPSFADIMQIKQNANRAANLVRQLLAFSRRQTLQPKVLDFTDTMAELSNLIRRLIGENIELNMVHGRDLWPLKADQGQLEQVIINLAVNARDAMRDGGTLTIRTSNVTINRDHPIDPEFCPPSQEDIIANGEFIQIEIIDTGEGIARNMIEKIFEPFFSTKEVGHGTGLGLSTVYGIIKQTGGYVFVKSRVGLGTTFALFIPRYIKQQTEEATETENEDVAAVSDLTGTATILLVEDETPVRIFAARALRNKGYEVLEADCGENAIEVFGGYQGNVEVIISDVVMPGMNGPSMVDELEKRFPDKMKEMEVIFISGYAEDAFIDSYGTDREFNFLPKPFTLKQLASKIKQVTAQKKRA